LADAVEERLERARGGGPQRHRDKLAGQHKLMPRERIARLFDADTDFVEDGLLAGTEDPELAAEGVVTGIGVMHGRTCAVMANDPTVKAGSWGPRTVEKIIRIQETAERLQIPLVYLVDSAGARITEQVAMFPGRRHAGHIFHMQVRLSGQVPQVCVLFGPSAAGGAYIPAFCDVVIMVEGNASMYLGSPRMAEVVVGEKVTLEEMGGARMHCTVSGCGDVLVADEDAGIVAARRYLEYLPQSWHDAPPVAPSLAVEAGCEDITDVIPPEASKGYDVMAFIRGIIDDASFFEIKRLFAREIVCGFARIDGHSVGILASQPRFKGGVLFVDSADKATRFITCCDAFNVPLVFLQDVPGFMVGSKVEHAGIIRHGAKMLHVMSAATVPKLTVVVRKAYGAGYYVMCGRAYEPDLLVSWPTGEISVMGAEGMVGIAAKKLFGDGEPPPEVKKSIVEMIQKNIDVYKSAGWGLVDDVIDPRDTRRVLAWGLELACNKRVERPARKRGVIPV